jgi:hypothetical protein
MNIRVDDWRLARVMTHDRDPFVVIVDSLVVPLDVEYRVAIIEVCLNNDPRWKL